MISNFLKEVSLICNRKTGLEGEPFMPFEADSSFVVKKEEIKEIRVHGLVLVITGIKIPKIEPGCIDSRTSSSRAISCSSQTNFRSLSSRKQR
ncbi:hypothetical protein V6N13_110458 [Hibiscus sabdariffa]